MLVLLFAIHQLDTDKAQERRQNKQILKHDQNVFDSQMSAQEAEHEAQKAIANAQLNVRNQLAQKIKITMSGDWVNDIIEKTAQGCTMSPFCHCTIRPSLQI